MTHLKPSPLFRYFSAVFILTSFLFSASSGVAREESKGGTRGGQVFDEVVNAQGACEPVQTPLLPQLGFTEQTRLGCTAGDQWEPAIAADDSKHVYMIYPQYGGVPGCDTCPSPTILLQISNDG